MLLIMLMLTELNGKVDQLDFASRMYNWMRHGFKELGDIGNIIHVPNLWNEEFDFLIPYPIHRWNGNWFNSFTHFTKS